MTTTTTTLTDRINAVAAGQAIAGTMIYWDEQDPANVGPAYRDGEESGELDFAGWAGGDGNYDGYNIGDYFAGDGRYLGPDQHGVYPTFA